MVFINQQVLLQVRETNIAAGIKICTIYHRQADTFYRSFLSLVHVQSSGCFYRFEVPVCVSLAVDIGHCRHNLSEEHPGLLFRQTVLCYDVVKQLPTCTVLRGRKNDRGREDVNLMKRTSYSHS